jgi:hypothetical protein
VAEGIFVVFLGGLAVGFLIVAIAYFLPKLKRRLIVLCCLSKVKAADWSAASSHAVEEKRRCDNVIDSVAF